jgi:antitoxin YefM
MRVLNFSETRAKLKSAMDRVIRDRMPVVISRKNGEAVVMIPVADRNATEEATHLLSQKANAGRLAAAIANSMRGEGKSTSPSSRETGLRAQGLGRRHLLAGSSGYSVQIKRAYLGMLRTPSGTGKPEAFAETSTGVVEAHNLDGSAGVPARQWTSPWKLHSAGPNVIAYYVSRG